MFSSRGSAAFCRRFCLPWRPKLASCGICRTRRKASNPRDHRFLFHRHHTSTQQPPKTQAKLLTQWIVLSLIRYVSARQILNIHLHSQAAQEASLSLCGEVLQFASTHGYMLTLMSEVSLKRIFCCDLLLLCCRLLVPCALALLDLPLARL